MSQHEYGPLDRSGVCIEHGTSVSRLGGEPSPVTHNHVIGMVDIHSKGIHGGNVGRSGWSNVNVDASVPLIVYHAGRGDLVAGVIHVNCKCCGDKTDQLSKHGLCPKCQIKPKCKGKKIGTKVQAR